jgi:hypothetical protein
VAAGSATWVGAFPDVISKLVMDEDNDIDLHASRRHA